jgi:hypothetical protein
VLPDPKARLAALADPATPDSTVVLDDPGPPPAGRPAALRTLTDSGDLVAVLVRADGDGYLVLGDAIQTGWSVTVDGRDAAVVDADHAFGGVFVPAGTHLVEFDFVGQGLRTGALITAAGLLIVLLVLLAPILRRRRRTSATADDDPIGPAAPDRSKGRAVSDPAASSAPHPRL